MKGYKIFNPDWTCRDLQYEVGKTYIYEGTIKICESGFHFCKKLADCFNYYKFDSNNKVAEIEAIGDITEAKNKAVTNKIRIVRELSWREVLDMCNAGKNNTGYMNSGNQNLGNRNSGNQNFGDQNSGNQNFGNWNLGNKNLGSWNSGTQNLGTQNLGNWNLGNFNSGSSNSGDQNLGNKNLGSWNSGNQNLGNQNLGSWNLGNQNLGNQNLGSWNSGNFNLGNFNLGDFNLGDWNSTNYSTGFFNTISQRIIMFNKETSLSYSEILSLRGLKILRNKFNLTKWISAKDMTYKEKENNPTYKTIGGYLKIYSHEEACKNMWDSLNNEEKQAVKDLPNFDIEIFKEITGIDINEDNNNNKN